MGEEKRSAGTFMRIHRPRLVNLTQVDKLLEVYVRATGKLNPLRHATREERMRQIRTG